MDSQNTANWQLLTVFFVHTLESCVPLIHSILVYEASNELAK